MNQTETDTPVAEAVHVKPPREQSKSERLVTMLQSGSGASLEDMTQATSWLPHTVRAAMTGLRKRGYAIERHVEGNTTVWSIKVAAK